MCVLVWVWVWVGVFGLGVGQFLCGCACLGVCMYLCVGGCLRVGGCLHLGVGACLNKTVFTPLGGKNSLKYKKINKEIKVVSSGAAAANPQTPEHKYIP